MQVRQNEQGDNTLKNSVVFFFQNHICPQVSSSQKVPFWNQAFGTWHLALKRNIYDFKGVFFPIVPKAFTAKAVVALTISKTTY